MWAWLRRIVQVRRVRVEIVRKEMRDEEFVRCFAVDTTQPFYQGVMELVERLKETYLENATALRASKQDRMDALAAIQALQEFRAHVVEKQKFAWEQAMKGGAEKVR